MMEEEEEEEGVVAVGLVAMVCLVEREEHVAVLVDLDLVELVAMVRPSVYCNDCELTGDCV